MATHTPQEILDELDRRVATGEILLEDYHRLRLGLLKNLRLQKSSDTALFSRITQREQTCSNGGTFCFVEPGPFLSGPDDQFSDTRAPYFIAKYPVTVREFLAFVQESGYNYPDTEVEQMILVSPYQDCPVSHISFLDAKEYCRWLRKKTGEYYSLPHEMEWEKAARGMDGRIYPWGMADPEADCACFQGQHHFDSTVPVTSFPKNVSPYGCVDMVGNVWEWCLDAFEDPRDPHILRGGGWCNPLEYANCLARTFSFPPDKRIDFGGFRLLYLTEQMLVDYRRIYEDQGLGEKKILRVVRIDRKVRPPAAAAKSGSLRLLADQLEQAVAKAAEKSRDGVPEGIPGVRPQAPREAVPQVLRPVVLKQKATAEATAAPAQAAAPEPAATAPAAPLAAGQPAADLGLAPLSQSRTMSRPQIPQFDRNVAATATTPAPVPTDKPPSTVHETSGAAAAGGPPENDDYMASVISNASQMYLRSKEKRPAGPPPVPRAPPPRARPAEPAPVATAEPQKPGSSTVELPKPGAAVPMVAVADLPDEAKSRDEARARRVARAVKNRPALTYGAFALWCVVFLAVVALFVYQLAG